MKKRTTTGGIQGLAFLALAGALLIGAQAEAAERKKVFFIDSYHEGYEWSDGIVRGVRSVLGDSVELEIHRMDTKNHPSEDFARNAGEEGESPESIGVVQNKKGNLYVNLPIAAKLGIMFPLPVLRNAEVIRN